MILDGTVVSAVFDDIMDMGIVGTTAGTLWYINWAENTSIRLISGHRNKARSFPNCSILRLVTGWKNNNNQMWNNGENKGTLSDLLISAWNLKDSHGLSYRGKFIMSLHW